MGVDHEGDGATAAGEVGDAALVAAVDGADDIELDYNTYTYTQPWVEGFNDYDDINNLRLLFDYGDSAACPSSGTTATAGQCNNGWTQANVWDVSSYYYASYPTPQIYTTDSVQARQWQQISLWGYLNGHPAIRFFSSFTQLGACAQRGCPVGIENDPDTGFSQLWDAIASDSRTFPIGFSWSTDVRYQYQ